VVFKTPKEERKELPHLLRRAYEVWRADGVSGLTNRILQRLPSHDEEREELKTYQRWVALYATLTTEDRQTIRSRIEKLNYRPLISVVMPVYNTEERWLRRAIESVQSQLYPQWELCIADDCSTAPHVRGILQEFAAKDERIKVVFRNTNGHISIASNSALELASGEFIALLDHDDELAEHALYMVAQELNAHPEADLIYSDEDKINPQGEVHSPHFKTDWNPDLFYSQNFISHLGVYRGSLVRNIGGFRPGYEGSQDYDLALRTIERLPEKNIRHIPHVLYHWRETTASVGFNPAAKEYAHENARKALRSHFERREIRAQVTPGFFVCHRVVYPLPDPLPLVSLIIGTRDRVELLRQVVEGVINQTDYDPIELIVVDNQSSDTVTLAYLDQIKQDSRIKVLRHDAAFNFSAINNLGVRHSQGEIIGLINNDLKMFSAGWLKELVSHAVRPEIGVVGAKLYYEDGSIQHAGVILGICGTAGHAYKKQPGDTPGYVFRAQCIQDFSAVTGACLFSRRKVFDEIGGLDEQNLPIAFNDVDYCLRARALGYRVLWTPYAELYHLESASRGPDYVPEKLARFLKESEYLRSKWEDVLNRDPYYNPNLSLEFEDFRLAFPPLVGFTQ
jgi:glycosyltransferase involved in cell wall biosynthesis